MRRKIPTTVYLEPIQVEAITMLAKEYKRPMAELYREAINNYLRTKTEELREIDAREDDE